MKLGKKAKIGIGAGITAAGILGILWGIFGGRKKGMSEDDYLIEGEAVEEGDEVEEDTES